jgi:hypothetical protein
VARWLVGRDCGAPSGRTRFGSFTGGRGQRPAPEPRGAAAAARSRACVPAGARGRETYVIERKHIHVEAGLWRTARRGGGRPPARAPRRPASARASRALRRPRGVRTRLGTPRMRSERARAGAAGARGARGGQARPAVRTGRSLDRSTPCLGIHMCAHTLQRSHTAVARLHEPASPAKPRPPPPWHNTATSHEPHTSPKSSRFPPKETLTRHVTAKPRPPPPWHTTATSHEPHTSPKSSRFPPKETLTRHVTATTATPTVAHHTLIHTLVRGARRC